MTGIGLELGVVGVMYGLWTEAWSSLRAPAGRCAWRMASASRVPGARWR
jgi:hypothetical protein